MISETLVKETLRRWNKIDTSRQTQVLREAILKSIDVLKNAPPERSESLTLLNKSLLEEYYIRNSSVIYILDSIGFSRAQFYRRLQEESADLVKILPRFVSLTPDSASKPVFINLSPNIEKGVLGDRPELDGIKHALTLGEARNIAIHGLPGIGKTSLLLLLANDPDIAQQFPDGILWCHQGSSEEVRLSVLSWFTAFREDTKYLSNLDVQTLSSALRGFLLSKRCLLLIDNVTDLEQAVLVCVGGRFCAHVISTRSHTIAYELAPRATISLDYMDSETTNRVLSFNLPPDMRAVESLHSDIYEYSKGWPILIS
jgi:hypothetical protein